MTQYPDELKAAETWSLMSDTPLCFYYRDYDAHLVYWGGIVMTRALAILIYSRVWLNMTPSSSLKSHAYNEYNRLYRTGMFGHLKWDSVFERYAQNRNLHDYLMNMIIQKTDTNKFFVNLKDRYDPSVALAWFMAERETVVQQCNET